MAFRCTLCPKQFSRPYNLRSHVSTHNNERPFVCPTCGKAFARLHDLKRHDKSVHHGGKSKFVCGGERESRELCSCGKKFSRSDGLRRHLRPYLEFKIGQPSMEPLVNTDDLQVQLWHQQSPQDSVSSDQLTAASWATEPCYGVLSPMDVLSTYVLPNPSPSPYGQSMVEMNWLWPDKSTTPVTVDSEDGMPLAISDDSSSRDNHLEYNLTRPGGAYSWWWRAYVAAMSKPLAAA